MLPLCPRYLRTQWVNDSDGHLIIGCAPAEIDDITAQELMNARATKVLVGLLVFVSLLFFLLGISEWKAQKAKNDRILSATSTKKIANAYPENIFKNS